MQIRLLWLLHPHAPAQWTFPFAALVIDVALQLLHRDFADFAGHSCLWGMPIGYPIGKHWRNGAATFTSHPRSPAPKAYYSRAFHVGSQGAYYATGGFDMLHYALVFLIIALVAGVLGFGGIAGAAAGIAKILFFVFLVIFLVSLVMGRSRVV